MRTALSSTGGSHLTPGVIFCHLPLSVDCKGLPEIIRLGSTFCCVSFACTHRSYTQHTLTERAEGHRKGPEALDQCSTQAVSQCLRTAGGDDL